MLQEKENEEMHEEKKGQRLEVREGLKVEGRAKKRRAEEIVKSRVWPGRKGRYVRIVREVRERSLIKTPCLTLRGIITYIHTYIHTCWYYLNREEHFPIYNFVGEYFE